VKRRLSLALAAGALTTLMIPSAGAMAAPAYSWDGRLAASYEGPYVWDGRLAAGYEAVPDASQGNDEALAFTWDGRLAG
jgi:hypothetical protein